MTGNVHICSLNCQGLGQKNKRERLKLWCENQKCDILFIQESHFVENMVKNLYNEYEYIMYHSFGNSQSRGVSIFIKKELNHKIINETKDEDGRIILLNIELKDNIITLINIYAPNNPVKETAFSIK